MRRRAPVAAAFAAVLLASAPAARLYKEFHITADHAAELVKQVLQRRTA